MTVTPTRKPKVPREDDPRNPRRRLAALFDEGSLEFISEDDGSGMLAAVGTVHGTHVVSFCSDGTVMGGAMGYQGCKVVVRAYERAMADQAPIIGLWHSGGARLAEGVLSLHAVGEIFHAMTTASGKIPQVSVVLGPAAGGAGARAPDVASGQQHVVQRRERRQQQERLEEKAHVPAARAALPGAAHRAHTAVLEPDLAAVRVFEEPEHVQQGALARAGGPGHDDDLAALHRETHAREHGDRGAGRGPIGLHDGGGAQHQAPRRIASAGESATMRAVA